MSDPHSQIYFPDFFKPTYQDLVRLWRIKILSSSQDKLLEIISILTIEGARTINVTQYELSKMVLYTAPMIRSSLRRLEDMNMIKTENMGRYGSVITLMPQSAWHKPHELLKKEQQELPIPAELPKPASDKSDELSCKSTVS